jgi:flagellar protein FliL
MAKAKEAEKPAEGAEGEEAPKKKMSLVSMLLFFGLPALLVIGGGVAAWLFLFSGSGEKKDEHGHDKVAAGPPPVFYDLPDMLVNLTAGEGQRAILKLGVQLELKDEEAKKKIEPVLPRVVDNFQVFLRELRVEDLSGSAGMFRLKEELLRRVNLAVAPVEVRDVLFEEMLIQ